MKLENGIQEGVPNAAYHADRKCVSSTWLKKIQKTPFHLRLHLDTPPPDVTPPALLMGSAVDTLVFEPELFKKEFIIMPELNLRTKDGRSERDRLIAKCVKTNQMLIKNSDHFIALQTAKAVRMNPVMARILQRGKTQQTFIWDDPVTELKCKCRTDWYDEEGATIYDLKTAQDASPEGFAKAIANFGYHIQAAFYSDGVRACNKPVERFVFCVQEKAAAGEIPNSELMAFYELSADDMQAGIDSYTSGLAAINFCMMTGEWTGYTDQILPISRPAWARKSDVEMVTSL